MRIDTHNALMLAGTIVVLGVAAFGGRHRLGGVYNAYRCRQHLQADLEAYYGPVHDPAVVSCAGASMADSACVVTLIERGAFVSRELRGDCSSTHFVDAPGDLEVWRAGAAAFRAAYR